MDEQDAEQHDVEQRLLLAPWYTLKIDTHKLWFKCAFDDAHCWMMVTDLASIW